MTGSSRTLCSMFLALLAGLGSGCAPQAKFVQATCDLEKNDGRVDRLAFVASIETNNMQDRQLVYWVRVLNAQQQPLRSTNGRFQDPQGHTAASKTLIVLKPKWTFENIRIAIPASELEARVADFPLQAEFSIAGIDGKVFATETKRIPVRPATRPPADATSSAETERGEHPGDGTATASDGSPASSPAPRRLRPGDAIRNLADWIDRASERAKQADTAETPAAKSAEAGEDVIASGGAVDENVASEARPREARRPRVDEALPPTASARAAREIAAPTQTIDETPVIPTADAPARTAATPATSTTQPALPRVYQVRKGDSLARIARRIYGHERYWEAISDANPNIDPAALQIGEILVLPTREMADAHLNGARGGTDSLN